MRTSEQIRNEIEKLNKELQALRILDGTASVVQEVKYRIIETYKEARNIDYILWPVRVLESRASGTKLPELKNSIKRTRWNVEMDSLLSNGHHQELIDKYGMSMAALACRANRLGKKFSFGKELTEQKQSMED